MKILTVKIFGGWSSMIWGGGSDPHPGKQLYSIQRATVNWRIIHATDKLTVAPWISKQISPSKAVFWSCWVELFECTHYTPTSSNPMKAHHLNSFLKLSKAGFWSCLNVSNTYKRCTRYKSTSSKTNWSCCPWKNIENIVWKNFLFSWILQKGLRNTIPKWILPYCFPYNMITKGDPDPESLYKFHTVIYSPKLYALHTKIFL